MLLLLHVVVSFFLTLALTRTKKIKQLKIYYPPPPILFFLCFQEQTGRTQVVEYWKEKKLGQEDGVTKSLERPLHVVQ